MADFFGVSKVEVNERFLDQVAAGRRKSSATVARSSGPGEGRAGSEEGAAAATAAARAQAREYVKIYFSLGQEND